MYILIVFVSSGKYIVIYDQSIMMLMKCCQMCYQEAILLYIMIIKEEIITF